MVRPIHNCYIRDPRPQVCENPGSHEDQDVEHVISWKIKRSLLVSDHFGCVLFVDAHTGQKVDLLPRMRSLVAH